MADNITLNEKVELARALFGPRESGRSAQMIRGTATSDSSDGTVEVQLEEGDPIEVGTIGAVREGDEVTILVQRNEPRVIAAEGWGDRVQSQVDTAAEAAETAIEVAQATGQHFWHDDNGAHVTTQEREDYEAEPQGPNAIFNSAGVAFYDGEDALAAFGPSGARIGRDDASHLDMTDRAMVLTDMDGDVFLDARDMRDERGLTLTTDGYTADGDEWNFFARYNVEEWSRVIVDDVETEEGFTLEDGYVSFDEPPVSGTTIVIEYYTDYRFHSFRFGTDSFAQGDNCAAFGELTRAHGGNQFVCGTRNERDDDALFIVGCGNAAENPRKNALTVRKDGTTVLNALDTSVFDTSSVSATIGAVSPSGTKTLTINADTRPGYTPIAVVGWYLSGASSLTIYRLVLNGTNVQAYLRNPGSSSTSASATFQAFVLYVKTA